MTFSKQLRENGGYIGVPGEATADPNWDNCAFLLSGQGANGATPATDATGKALSWGGAAAISTAQSKWYGSSVSCGAGQVTCGYNPALNVGAANFTAQAWAYSSNTNNPEILSRRPDNPSTQTFPWSIVVIGASNTVQWSLSDTSASTVVQATAGSFPANQWNHAAMVRAGAMLFGFINGLPVLSVQIGAGTSPWNSSAGLGMGRSDNAASGLYICDATFIPGVAKWTAPFVPPARDALTTARRYPSGLWRL